jgi:hypothetical protein
VKNGAAVHHGNTEGSSIMAAEAIATLVKMLESLPETAQDQVVVHLREYIEELRDELRWDVSFEKTQAQLAATGKRAK